MKTKQHQFVVTVNTTRTKEAARIAVFASFARRNPDGCEFHLLDMASHRRNQHRRIMRACEETRKRMNSYTPEQRAELEKKAREIIDKAAKRGANPKPTSAERPV